LTAIQFYLADEMLNEFSTENNILVVRATLGPLFEEAVSESINSEAASLSSPQA